jgi:ABC-2 type transport system permease protein
MVIVIFLLANGLFIWVFPGGMNILESGYASLDPLFDFAPWVFLFLVPALTMRLFAEEKRNGTLELLLTRPLREYELVLAKYLAGLVLVILSLLPGIVYYISVYQLGAPAGNIDTGGTLGSYVGLFFLSAIYVALGTFSSSITDNQIVAFLLAVVLSFVFYTGFDSLAALSIWGQQQYIVESLGINNHYMSMSRGVIDSRDLVYFLSVIAFFLYSTQLIITRSITTKA